LCLFEKPEAQPGMMSRPPIQQQGNGLVAAPLWKEAPGVKNSRHPLTADGDAIYLIATPADANRTRNTGSMGKGHPFEPDLVCLVPESREPLIIPIRLDPNAGPVTVSGGPSGSGAWIECSSEYLFIGASSLRGVWALPKAEIRAELGRQIQARPPNPKEVTAEDSQKALLGKYDLNHNGQFDVDERESAISDPAFLEFEIDKIDANTNGQLDTEELNYFDANNNRILDAPELAGIQAAQHILAVKALKEFDMNESGRLEPQEYWKFTRGKPPSVAGLRAMQTLPASSEADRIEHYLEAATEDSVRQRLMRMGRDLHPESFHRELDPTLLKQEIEIYWARQKTGL
jgi:hypothetical protein